MKDPREAAAEYAEDQPKIDAFVAGWKAGRADPMETLGDIGVVIRKMKADGMTRASILYVIDRVYVLDAGVYRDDPTPCPYDHSHTRAWCGNPQCRES